MLQLYYTSTSKILLSGTGSAKSYTQNVNLQAKPPHARRLWSSGCGRGGATGIRGGGRRSLHFIFYDFADPVPDSNIFATGRITVTH